MDDDDLSVRERIEVALAHLYSERKQPSIALVCRLAAVSRANLYTSHPDILEGIRSLKERKSIPRSRSPQKHVDAENRRELKKTVDTLAYTCLELRHALDEQRAQGARLIEEIASLKQELLRVQKSSRR